MQKKAITLLTVVTALTIYQLNDGSGTNAMNKNDLAVDSLDINFGHLFSQWKNEHHKMYESVSVIKF